MDNWDWDIIQIDVVQLIIIIDSQQNKFRWIISICPYNTSNGIHYILFEYEYIVDPFY